MPSTFVQSSVSRTFSAQNSLNLNPGRRSRTRCTLGYHLPGFQPLPIRRQRLHMPLNAIAGSDALFTTRRKARASETRAVIGDLSLRRPEFLLCSARRHILVPP